MLEKLINTIKENGLTAHEIAKNTGISPYGVRKILKGTTKKPRPYTLEIIRDYVIFKSTGVESTEKKAQLNELEANVLKNWEALKRRKKGFYRKLKKEIQQTKSDI